MEASLLLGTLRRLGFGLGGLFGGRPRARPVRPRPVERRASPARPRSVIAAFEQGGTPSRPSTQHVKLAVVTSAAPLAPMAAIPIPIAPARSMAGGHAAKVASLVAVTPPAAGMPAAPDCEDAAPARKMRSLEEVRADLARLRANAKERHAQLQAQLQVEAQARRDTSFAPTDFLDFAPPPAEPASGKSTESSFAPTAFFDLTSLKASA